MLVKNFKINVGQFFFPLMMIKLKIDQHLKEIYFRKSNVGKFFFT